MQVILLMFCIFNTQAQKENIYRSDSLRLLGVRKIVVELDTTQTGSSTLHTQFGHIRVLDVRFDTTMIDYFSSINDGFTFNSESYKVDLEGSVSSSFTRVLNHYYKNNLQGTEDAGLIFFFKKLNASRVDSIINYEHHLYNKLNFIVEVFLNKGNKDYAACKIDTVFLTESPAVSQKRYAHFTVDSLVIPAITVLERTVDNTDWSVVLQRKAFDTEFVYKHYYHDRFNIPILTQPYNRGVYKTYKEFLLNKPSIKEFTVEERKLGINILKDSAGNVLPMLSYFGYCDGKACWIMTKIHASPLFRVGNTFEFFHRIEFLRENSLDSRNARPHITVLPFLGFLDLEWQEKL